MSVESQGSSVVRQSQNSSSNLSQLTNYTDPNSPEVAPVGVKQRAHEHTSAPHDVPRMRTPEASAKTNGVEYASPMSIASPVAINGAKRTASGYVKISTVTSQPSTPVLATSIPGGRRPRTESVSSTGSRAGELAQQLKSRLGYAMAKVQHGWEHKSIAEVEVLARLKMSPGRNGQHEGAVGGYEGLQEQRRPESAGLSNGTARMSMYELQSPQHHFGFDGATSPPSKRRSGTYGAFGTSRSQHPQESGYTRLQPPAVIRQTSTLDGSFSRHYQPQPTSTYGLHSNGTTYTTTSAMSPPRTPVAGNHLRSHAQSHMQADYRPPTVRTTTQTAEAERDALQALFQLGSPRASQLSSQSLQQHQSDAMSRASSTQASPLRTEYSTPRRVTFAATTSDSEGSSGSSAEAREGSSERA